jgi:hypothetical protein
MQTFTYPASDLDDRSALLNVLGSFWARTYEGVDQLASYTRATANVVAQTQLNLLETVAAISRYDVPVFHTENWYPLVLRKSELQTTAANQYRFDVDNIEFNDTKSVQFNQYAGRDFFAVPAPTDFHGAGQIFDRLLFPAFGLLSGVDFIVDEDTGAILFVVNPFESESVTRRPIYSGDVLVDEEITLWAFKAQFDYGYVFQQFAYAVNVNLSSSENAKALVNAIITGLVAGGASEATLADAMAAIFDVPVVRNAAETVAVITLDNRGLLICTDREVYRFDAAAVPTVSVGDTVRRGDRLVDVFQIFELNRGEVPETISALALDTGYTSACFYGDLIFENRDVPLIVDAEHPSGYTYVRFPLGGLPNDVRGFFDELHARGIEQLPTTPAECDKTGFNKRLGTLAHILDRRTNPAGEPQPADLPATINPLQFIVKNVLRNNAVIAAVRVSTLGKNHLGLYNIRHIRQLLPPGSGLFLIYTLASRNNQIDGTTALTETLTKFKCAEPLADVVAATRVKDGGVIVRSVSGTCQ